MRTKLRSKVTLLFMTCAVLLAIPAVALADLVEDNIVVNGNDTIGLKADGNGGFTGSTTVNYKIVQQGTQCEPAFGDDATVTVNTPAGVTASPSTLTFNKCDTAASPASQDVTLTATSFAANGQEVSVSVADTDATGNGANGYNVNNAKFNLQVQKATGISGVSGSATEGGTATLKATLSSLYAASENMQGKNIQFKIGTTVVGTDATDSTGLAELSGVTLPAGFTAANTYNGAVTATFDGSTDTTYVGSSGTGNLVVSPACTNPAGPTFSGTPNGDNGWYKTTVPTVSASSSTSGAVIKYSDAANGTYSETAPTLNEGTTTVYAKAFSSTGSCSSAAVSNTYKVDTIAPQINDDGTTQTPNGAGWFNTAVTNNFSASDATSGLASAANFTNSSGTDEGSAVNINSGPVSDNAGNTNPGIDSAAFMIDLSGPTITDLGPTTNANGAGWYKADVTNRFKASDSLSGPNSACVTNFPLSAGDNVQSKTTSGEGTTVKVTSDSCTDVAGNTAAGIDSAAFKIDKTDPTISATLNPLNPAASGWYNISTGAPKASYTCGDTLSGLDGTCPGVFTFGEGNNLSHSETISDKAGNEATAAVNNIKVDLTKPSVSVTGVSNGATYTTGNVPTPGCNTTDALSGPKTNATVNVTGGTSGFGNLTATCSGAEDNAGNTNSASVTYGVSAAFNGFLQPIDGHSVNTGKYGRTYPIKWQLRDSSGALISDSDAQALVTNMTGGQKAVSCTSFDLADTDALEEATTGNTSLRYDATSDQFIYNYKAPTSGTCYVFAIRNADGLTTQQIDFKFTK